MPMEVIRDLDQIDRKLKEIEKAAYHSDAAMRKIFSEFCLDFSEVYKDLPRDPFSDEYWSYQMKMYERLAGKSYRVENEVSHLDVAAATTHPFPYTSKSTAVAGMHLSALGYLISRIEIPSGSKIIEFGAGWGNTTLALALLGYEVTVVEIEARFCELIQARAKLHGVAINVINGDFFACETIKDKFDAALFYECFHHCSDHMRLFRGLHNVLRPTGYLYLGAEPVLPDFPIPWGLRMDGESLWAIRQNGWMELGYREDYFVKAFESTGWSGSLQRSADVGFANVWTLRRSLSGEVVIPISEDVICSAHPKGPHGLLTADGDVGYIIWGPYINLQAGHWRATINVKADTENCGAVIIDICQNYGRDVVAKRDIDLMSTNRAEQYSLDFVLRDRAVNVEVRLFGVTPTSVTISSVEFCQISVAASEQHVDGRDNRLSLLGRIKKSIHLKWG